MRDPGVARRGRASGDVAAHERDPVLGARLRDGGRVGRPVVDDEHRVLARDGRQTAAQLRDAVAGGDDDGDRQFHGRPRDGVRDARVDQAPRQR